MRNENLPKKEGGVVSSKSCLPHPSIPSPTEVQERVERVYICSSYSYIYIYIYGKHCPISPMMRTIPKRSD